MVRLDQVRFRRTSRFDRVRVDGALPQNPVAVEEMFGLEDSFLYLHELFANCPALFLGVVQPMESCHELGFRPIDKKAPSAKFRKSVLYKLSFALAHQTGIDIDAEHAFWT